MSTYRYRANLHGEPSIDKIDVNKESKSYRCHKYFDTYDEAKDYLTKFWRDKHGAVKIQLREIVNNLVTAEGLSEP